MKLLLVDIVCWREHVSYNNYWIKALNSLNIPYDAVFVGDYAKLLTDLKAVSRYSLTGELGKGGFDNSMKMLKQLNGIVDCSVYDRIIFTAVNKLAFIISPLFFKTHSVIVSHVWPDKIGFKSQLCYKIINTRHNLISLDMFLQAWLMRNGINTTEITHPIPSMNVVRQACHRNNKVTIFSPSKGIDSDFLRNIIECHKFHDWLNCNNVKLILRNNDIEYHASNIDISKGYIPQSQYNKLFYEADAILIAYPSSFKTRVSNVFYEAIGAAKPMLIKEGTHLDEYLKFGDEGLYVFEDIDSLKSSIKSIVKCTTAPQFVNIRQHHSVDNMSQQVQALLQI